MSLSYLLAQLQAIQPAPQKPAAARARLKNLLLGGKAQSEKAFANYRRVMAGRGWVTQRQVETSLGYASTVSSDYLAKLLKEGFVERRNKGGADRFVRRIGYEWRWKDDAQ